MKTAIAPDAEVPALRQRVQELERQVAALQAREAKLVERERDVAAQRRDDHDLIEAARRKDEFLAILSHELRNPLAPIRYALSLVGHPSTTAEHRRHAEEVIGRQVEHMGRLLDDLLDVSRIARGSVELNRRWIDLTTVLAGSIDAARPLIDQKGHTLALDIPREALRFEADPVRVTQVLTNLLNNAAKYTDHGGEIQLRAWREGDTVAIAVRDNGIGISREVMPRVFHLFTQATPALQRAEGGLGIGLALVKGFVERHGGSVDVQSEGPGRGSEFTVRFPVGQPQRAAGTAVHSSEPARTRRLRVLVADDNADSAQTCAMLLQLWGHDVRIAHGGHEALDIGDDFKPQLALLDIGMPHMNGYELAEKIRARPWGRDAMLVAVTGWGKENDKERASRASFNHHLTKPVDPSVLEPLLQEIG